MNILPPNWQNLYRSEPIVLVVDDDTSNRVMLGDMLRSLGSQVVEAKDGQEALDQYAQHKPDLVLLDYMMPNMSGLEACQALNRLYGPACCPIIMVTALNDNDSIRQAFESGAFDYITKPYHVGIIRNRMSRLLQSLQFQQAIEQRNQMLETLYLVSRSASSTLSISDILERVVYITAHAVDASLAYICDLKPEEDSSTVLAEYFDPHLGGLPARDLGTHYSLSQTFPHLSDWISTRQGYSMIHLSRQSLGPEEQAHYQKYGVQSLFIIRLEAEGKLLGYMEYWYQEAYELSPMQVQLLDAAASQVAMILNNALLHEQSQHYLRDLEERNQELDAYSHTIAHDLKNPLQLISNYILLVKMDNQDLLAAEHLEYLDRATKAGIQMAGMIENLLQMALLRDAIAEARPVDMRDSLEAALARFTDVIEKTGVQVEKEGNFLPALGHAPWLEEVWANLIGNAIKYMGADNPHPHLILRGGLAEEGWARYEVKDNGIGIKAEDYDKLFKMFSRLTNTGTTKGLGLSIVQRIVAKLKGRVGLESQPGQGSTFWFELPHAADPWA
jgi:signal transduction histidine kinase/CheY-like chemotaxis protein